MIRENVNLSVRLAVGLLILGFLELFVLAASGMMGAGFFFFFLYKIVETFVIYYLVLMAKKLKDGGKRVANGNYDQPIDTRHMIAPLKEHGEVSPRGRGDRTCSSRSDEERAFKDGTHHQCIA